MLWLFEPYLWELTANILQLPSTMLCHKICYNIFAPSPHSILLIALYKTDAQCTSCKLAILHWFIYQLTPHHNIKYMKLLNRKNSCPYYHSFICLQLHKPNRTCSYKNNNIIKQLYGQVLIQNWQLKTQQLHLKRINLYVTCRHISTHISVWHM